MTSITYAASSRAVVFGQRLVRFGRRRPATLVWLLLYAVVAIVAPSPLSLLVTAGLVTVLALRLRLAERSDPRHAR
ncbi:MAG TPA: hypothetical protein VF612_17960 [Jatrophihabitans sp.]|uniref:hypothetical protein n=1 Tax=Jatrophihabitans sp. TaxID=1932789 RepID=UPI002F0110D0